MLATKCYIATLIILLSFDLQVVVTSVKIGGHVFTRVCLSVCLFVCPLY